MTDTASFSPEFANWIATADMAELQDAYCDNYKDAHGIKARWVYGRDYTREEFATMFVQLGHEIEAECERDRQRHAEFTARIETLGLTSWAAENGIHTEYDLMDYNMRQEAADYAETMH